MGLFAASIIIFFFFSVFHPIPETGEEGREEEKSEGKNDNNNNAETDNMNTTKSTTQTRYFSWIKVFQFLKCKSSVRSSSEGKSRERRRITT